MGRIDPYMGMLARSIFNSFAWLAIATLIGASPAMASRFANQFVEFEVPPQWQCALEGAEWVCQSQNEGKKREAIIVLAAKLKGDQDSLDQYLAFLKGAKAFTSVQGKPVKSDPKFAKTVSINGHPWVDALHLESEIPGFYTRYLATVKQDIGVLVTYSINKAKYSEYQSEFDNLIRTLKVFRKGGGINAAPAAGNLFQQAQIPTQISNDSIFPGVAPQGGSDVPAQAAKSEPNENLFYLGLAGAVVLVLILRRRNSGG